MHKTTQLLPRIGIGVSMLCIASAALAAAPDTPREWLDRMAVAVEELSYEGRVVRLHNGRAETMAVTRRVNDGEDVEKLVSQDGVGREIIRKGNEVHCILPDQRSVLVEQWNDRSSWFSSLPSGGSRFGKEYDVSLIRKDRVAGRSTVLIAIRPHDRYRYEHRLWLDTKTAFPLRTKILDSQGGEVEQVLFASIDFDSDIPATALATSIDIDNFTWYNSGAATASQESSAAWECTDLPPGFRQISSNIESMLGADEPIQHLVYSDGLASVSVFVANSQNSAKDFTGRFDSGAAHAYTIEHSESLITVVGEVPAVTVERIARAMRRR